MTIKPDSRWRPSFEKARGRLLVDKLMAGGGFGTGETTEGVTAAAALSEGASRTRSC